MSAARAPASGGYALAVATLGSAVIVIPAALRAATGGAGLAMAWLALWGSAALMIAPVAGACRVARPLSPFAFSLPLGLALALGPLMVFARVLKTATHHRPLGAATFALVAAILVLGATAFSARVIAWSRGRGGALSKLPHGLAALGLALGAVLLLPALSSALRSSLFDGVLGVAVVAAAAWAPEKSALGRVGLVLWLVVVAAGLGLGLSAPTTRAALAEHAPVLLGLSGWLRP